MKYDEDMRQLAPIELSALCSNLARGCEKQYKPEQAEAFQRLSDWLKSRGGKAADPSFDALMKLIDQSLAEGYPEANAVSAEKGDRGALRSLAWGEKVTYILKSLLIRFANAGDTALRSTGVYVCTICGFVYVGDELPEVCPICKVPSRKFERIGG